MVGRGGITLHCYKAEHKICPGVFGLLLRQHIYLYFKNQKLHFWLKWHTLYPLNAFSFCNWEENRVGKHIPLDIMEHVYLRGYHFSGSATHRSSTLMDIEM